MPSKTLTKATASAQALHKLCQTTPNMNAYQRIATSAVEICVAATRGTRNKAQSLATYAVKRTGALITKECSLPLSPERRVDFDAFERTLDDIRQYIETIPGQATRSQKMFSTLKSSRKSALLKAELDRTYHVLSESPQKAATHSPASQIGSILRASAVLSLAVGPCPAMAPLVALICDNGQRSNRAAAMALAQHAQAVTDCIVDRATALPLAGQGDSERALMALRL
ncbi:hypothetical protein B0H10DRAFT_525873 [Mycena sp. CBHHK59/15]|nr:hypothetical protein B0H10DRAFT_525873 [Mycena sp. CBHHK59/15]